MNENQSIRMGKVCLLLICSLLLSHLHPSFVFADPCNSTNAPITIDPNNVQIANEVNNRTFNQIIGVNAGKEWDQIYTGQTIYNDFNPLTKIFPSVRSFHTMEKDYECDSILFSCSNNSSCSFTPASCSTEPACNLESMEFYKSRYKKWKTPSAIFSNNHNYQAPEYLIASLEAIITCDSDGTLYFRSFPDKWYTSAEWGSSPTEIEQNAQYYTEVFIEKMCPDQANCLVDLLEIGNEPWGEPGVEAYRAICKGVIKACMVKYGNNPDTWPMKLSTAAFQAHREGAVYECQNCTYDVSDYIGTMIPNTIYPDLNNKSMYYYLDALNMHSYSFEVCGNQNGENIITEHPESTNSDFQQIKSMIQWAINNGHDDLDINVTEYGWDSNTVGAETQANYNIRATLLMARWGINKAIVYESVDNPALAGFNNYHSSGMFTVNSNNREMADPKPTFLAFAKLKLLLGDLKHLSMIKEEDNGAYAFLLGDNSNDPKGIVVWLAKSSDANNLNITETITIDDIAANYNKIAANEFYKLDDRLNFNLINGNTDATFTNLEETYSSNGIINDLGNQWQIQASRTPYWIPLIDDTNPISCGPSTNSPDLAVDITADKTNFDNGDNITFNVKVCNTGNTTMADIELNATFQQSGFVSKTVSQGTFSAYYQGQFANLWQVGTLNVGEEANLSITFYQNNSMTTDNVVTAYLTNSNPTDNNTSNNQSTVTVVYGDGDPPTATADLSVNITANKSNFTNEDNITFNVKVCNIGDLDMSNVEVQADFQELGFVSKTLSHGIFSTYYQGELVNLWEIGTLNAGEEANLYITFYQDNNINTDNVVTANLINSDPTDNNTSNNQSTVTVIYEENTDGPDLSVNITADKNSFTNGDNITFNVKVCNIGNTIMTDVDIKATFQQSGFVSKTVSHGTFSAYYQGQFANLWQIGTLNIGEEANLHITFYQSTNVNADNVVVAYLDNSDPIDSNTNNNQSTVTVIYNPDNNGGGNGGGGTVNSPDLTVNITADKNNFTNGESITFTVTVENIGNETMTDVKLRADFQQSGFVSSSVTQGTFSRYYQGQFLNLWQVGTLNVGETAELTATYYQNNNVNSDNIVQAYLTTSSPSDNIASNNQSIVTVTYNGNGKKGSHTPQNSLKVLYNPSGQFTLQVEKAEQQMTKFSVYNTMGQLLHQQSDLLTAGSHFIDFDAGQLTSGIYLVSMEDATGQVYVEKVIVQ